MALGQFLKRRRGLEERKTGVAEKLESLRKEVTKKEADLAASRETLAKCLGDLALNETEQAQQAVGHARKSVERLEQAVADGGIMIQALQKELARVEVERLESVVREVPGHLKEVAETFNLLLGQSLDVIQTLRELHSKMWQMQEVYKVHMSERTQALNALGRVEPLEAPTFGVLAGSNVPATHRYTPQIPETRLLDRLVNELLSYESKLAGYGDGKGLSADWPVGDRDSVGAVGTPGQGLGKLQTVFDSERQQ